MPTDLPPYTVGLHPLADGAYAYLQPPGSWGWSNAGLIVDGSEALLFDTAFTLALTRQLQAATATALPEVRIGTVVISHQNGDHAWGLQLFPDARIISSEHTAAGMHAEIPPAAMTAMRLAGDPNTPVARYQQRFFGGFDFDGIQVCPPTETFTGELTVKVGRTEVHLLQVGPAHTEGDVIAYVPAMGVAFIGDIGFFSDHPVMWSGPVEGWIRACEIVLDTGASIIVPGHGPVGGPVQVRAIREYFHEVGEHANRCFDQAMSYWEAAADFPLDRYRGWGHPERLVLTYGAIWANRGQPEPGGRLALITRMAELFESRSST